MKAILLSLFTFTSLNVFAANVIWYSGVTQSGEECVLETSRPDADGPSNMVMNARVSGPGVPFYLGAFTTTFHYFKIIRRSSDSLLVSLVSERSPSVEISEKDGNLSAYKLYLVKDGDNVINCKDLIQTTND